MAAALRASGLIALLVGCGPRVILEQEEGGGSTGETSRGDSTTSGTTVGPEATTTTTTTGITTGGVTTDPPDDSGGPPVIIDEGPCFIGPCDPWEQDCPRGEQCNPSNLCEAGDTWGSPRCFPLGRNPAPIGEVCTTEDSPYSGKETCGLDGFCWDVDSTTFIGRCVALCTGSADAPFCADPSTSCLIANDGALPLCLPSCDPLLQDCEADHHGCHPVAPNGEFVCMPNEAPIQTDQQPTFCSPGSTDVDAALLLSKCFPDQGICCASYCDLNDAQCDPGLECAPFYDEGQGLPPPAPLGLCVDP